LNLGLRRSRRERNAWGPCALIREALSRSPEEHHVATPRPGRRCAGCSDFPCRRETGCLLRRAGPARIGRRMHQAGSASGGEEGSGELRLQRTMHRSGARLTRFRWLSASPERRRGQGQPHRTKGLGKSHWGTVYGKTQLIQHQWTMPLVGSRAISALTCYRSEGTCKRCGIGALGQPQIVHTHGCSLVFLFHEG
jgi:hypothetical protein